MNIKGTTVAEFPSPYSVCMIPEPSGPGLPVFAVGSEARDGSLYLFKPPEYKPELLAAEPGGFISLWPVTRGPCRSIMASVRFFPFFEAAQSQICVYPLDAQSEPNPAVIADLPYTHRIAVCRTKRADYLLASTLCAQKDFRDDWSHPGGIFVAQLGEDLNQQITFRQIVTGLSKNHGMDFAAFDADQNGGFLLSAEEGLFYLPIPDDPESQWLLEELAPGPHSDAFAHHWFGAVPPALFTISPFHGNTLSMYRKVNDSWHPVVLADDLEMGHIVWAGSLFGQPAVIAGGRRGRQELRLYRDITPAGASSGYDLIDEQIGAAQIAVFQESDTRALLFVSAHSVGKVRIYELNK